MSATACSPRSVRYSCSRHPGLDNADIVRLKRDQIGAQLGPEGQADVPVRVMMKGTRLPLLAGFVNPAMLAVRRSSTTLRRSSSSLEWKPMPTPLSVFLVKVSCTLLFFSCLL